MAKKFIIWTMQRSGGTSFTRIIETLGNYGNVKHEPFNGNQEYGYVLKNRPKQPDRSVYYDIQLEEIFLARPEVSFKHCYEVHDDQLNYSLYKQAKLHGYVNVFLTRTNNFERQVSLNLAKKTGAWSKSQFSEKLACESKQLALPELDIEQMIEHEITCREKEEKVREMLNSDGEVCELQYEILYAGNIENRFSILDDALNVLNVPTTSDNINVNEDKIISLLMFEKQTTEDVYSAIPNFDAAKETFAAIVK